MDNYHLEMVEISKSFGGVKVLEDVSLRVRRGEIHALVGENGAGKSTLMKILSGVYQKDAGEIYMDSQKLNIRQPLDAKKKGIAVIYQEFVLAPDLTVAENIFIDKMAEGGILINWPRLREKAKEQLEKLGFDNIDPNARVGDLTVAYQQVVEICKCLAREADVLVFDEPTAVLTFAEVEKLFDVIRKLKEKGVSIIYISHRLEEVLQLSDNITVLKDGRCVQTVQTSSVNKNELVTMMVGRELKQIFPKRNAVIGEVVLKVEELNIENKIKDVSFEVKAGEVVGFSGLVGAGRTETMEAIFGARPRRNGKVFLREREVYFKHPREAVKSGLGMLPEDRKKQGLVLEKSILVNTTLASLWKICNFLGVIKRKKERKLVTELLESISTKYDSIDDNIEKLSGGNQQKVSLAKWISTECGCVIFDEPTRGVDVGAKIEIYSIINKLAESGVAVIVISSEMLEIIGVCDRVLVMRDGEIAGELNKGELNEDNLIRLAMGVA